MYRLLLLISSLAMLSPVFANETEGCVVLLHGLARSASSMEKMAAALERDGYHIVNHAYPSLEDSIEELVNSSIPEALADCGQAMPIHFVTHSMGGILVRAYLNTHKLPKLGRVVMLAPPSQGSEAVDKLKNFPGFALFTGKAGAYLGTDNSSVPLQLGAVTYPVGIITGDRSLNLILSLLIPGTDDGKVSVERAKLAGMADFLVLPHTHAFIMRSDEVIMQTRHFLRYGYFYR
jgi:triacylglycerol lipase